MKKIIYVLFFSFIGTFVFIYFINKKVSPSILKYSTVEADRFASVIINTSFKTVTKNNNSNLVSISKNSIGEIKEINFDTDKVNYLLRSITKDIQKNVLLVEEGKTDNFDISSSLKGNNFKHIRKGVVCEMPVGSIYSSSFMANYGPIIPIKLTFIGNVSTSIDTTVKSYGINNAYIEVDVLVEVNERISIPSLTKNVKLRKKLPIVMKVIQGTIPDYYGGGFENSYNYVLPIK